MLSIASSALGLPVATTSLVVAAICLESVEGALVWPPQPIAKVKNRREARFMARPWVVCPISHCAAHDDSDFPISIKMNRLNEAHQPAARAHHVCASGLSCGVAYGHRLRRGRFQRCHRRFAVRFRSHFSDVLRVGDFAALSDDE